MTKTQPIDDWLEAHNAHPLLIERNSDGDRLVWYAVAQTVILLQEYAGKNGWEVWIKAAEASSIQATLDALDERIKGSTT